MSDIASALEVSTTENLQDYLAELKAERERKRGEMTERRLKLAAELIKEADPADALVFSCKFDGCGDSGQVYQGDDDAKINELLEDAVDCYVDFNWWDNAGGAGDLTWDARSNTITINAYRNIETTETVYDDDSF